MLSVPKAIGPVLLLRKTPVSPDWVELELPKLRLALEFATIAPMPKGLVMVVVELVRPPPTSDKLMPVVALLLDEILLNDAESVPVVRFRAWPVPFSVTSAMVKVPKLVPLISVPEFPPVKPRSVLPAATLIPFEALVTLTIVAFPLLVAG